MILQGETSASSAWTTLCVASAVHGFGFAWFCVNGAGHPWYANVVIVWLLMTMLINVGRWVDRVEPPGVSHPGMEVSDGPAGTCSPWVEHGRLLVRPGLVPSSGDRRAGRVYRWMWIWLLSFVAGTILFISLNV